MTQEREDNFAKLKVKAALIGITAESYIAAQLDGVDYRNFFFSVTTPEPDARRYGYSRRVPLKALETDEAWQAMYDTLWAECVEFLKRNKLGGIVP